LKLALLCSHSEPLARPSMRQVVQYLEKDVPLPDLSMLSLSSIGLTFGLHEDFQDCPMSYPSSMDRPISHTSSIAESLLSGGRWFLEDTWNLHACMSLFHCIWFHLILNWSICYLIMYYILKWNGLSKIEKNINRVWCLVFLLYLLSSKKTLQSFSNDRRSMWK